MAYGSTLAEALDSAAERKSRGAFFTPPQIAEFISSRVIVSSNARILEPSCGEAEFALAACRRLDKLGGFAENYASQVLACELHPESVKAANKRLLSQGYSVSFKQGDFLQLEADASFDAVVGNPPYVRFQVIDADQRACQQRIAAHLGIELSALASTWAPFVLHACEFLRAGGRLGLVLPAELLSVNYAAPIRSFLLRSFADVQLYTFEKNVFPEVQEEVVLLVACGYHTGRAESIQWHQCEALGDLATKRSFFFVPGSEDERWTFGLASVESQGILKALVQRGLLMPLEQWGSIALGAVTGANTFFAMTPQSALEFGLVEGKDVVWLCPPRLEERSASFA